MSTAFLFNTDAVYDVYLLFLAFPCTPSILSTQFHFCIPWRFSLRSQSKSCSAQWNLKFHTCSIRLYASNDESARSNKSERSLGRPLRLFPSASPTNVDEGVICVFCHLAPKCPSPLLTIKVGIGVGTGSNQSRVNSMEATRTSTNTRQQQQGGSSCLVCWVQKLIHCSSIDFQFLLSSLQEKLRSPC